MNFRIERSTRQWLGIVILGGVIAAMMFTGLIPAAQYQKYTAFVLGAFFYHIIRMLNGPETTVPSSTVVAVNPTDAPKEG